MMNSTDLFQTDSEVAVLSIILQNPSKFYEIKNLKPSMFSSEPNKLLYATFAELCEQGLTPEINLIHDFLKAQGKDLQIGGKDYLNFLYKQNYNQDNVNEFERLVINSFKARTLISLSGGIPASVVNTASVDSVIENLRKSLDSLTQASGGDRTVSMEEALKTSWEGLVERIKSPGIKGVTTGIAGLDTSSGGMSAGDLWVLAGRPGMGKTAVMCNLMLNQAQKGYPVLIFSLEMNAVSLVERMLSVKTSIPSTEIRLGLLTQDKIDKVYSTIREIKGLPIYIDSNYFMNIEYVLSTIRKYKINHGIKVVYLDYIQLLADRTQDATNELGRISRMLKLIANELEISILYGSQLSRAVELREDKRPILSDLRQSGNLEEDADVAIGLYREFMYNKKTSDKNLMELLILKQRNGPVGMLPVDFNQETLQVTSRI